ncbi:MAG TPA: hypothetical protein VGI13_02405 [Candidatus Acidoferrum sp.]|jgi:hypothetical protein
MKTFAHFWLLVLMLSVALAGSANVAQQASPQNGQSPTPPAAKEPPATAQISRLTIEVTGGDASKPVENASVYLKTLDQKLLKDKKFEVNVKTNLQGIAHVPEAPTGRVLIQVVATGWKPYGHWYDVSDPQQTIKVHLERPPKWY